ARLDFPNVTRVLIGQEEPASSLPSVPRSPDLRMVPEPEPADHGSAGCGSTQPQERRMLPLWGSIAAVPGVRTDLGLVLPARADGHQEGRQPPERNHQSTEPIHGVDSFSGGTHRVSAAWCRTLRG